MEMHDILLLSNSQILKTSLSTQKNYRIIYDSNESENSIEIIIFDNEHITQLENFLDKTNHKKLFLIEIGTKQIKTYHQDYLFLARPFRIRDLLDAIDNIIKDNSQNLLELKQCFIDTNKRILISKNDQKIIKLTELEIGIINYLYNQNNAATKHELLEKIWGYKNVSNISEIRLIESIISKLKKKLFEAGIENFITITEKNHYQINK